MKVEDDGVRRMGGFRGPEEMGGAAVVYHGSLFRERERFAVVEDMKKKAWIGSAEKARERGKSKGARREDLMEERRLTRNA